MPDHSAPQTPSVCIRRRFTARSTKQIYDTPWPADVEKTAHALREVLTPRVEWLLHHLLWAEYAPVLYRLEVGSTPDDGLRRVVSDALGRLSTEEEDALTWVLRRATANTLRLFARQRIGPTAIARVTVRPGTGCRCLDAVLASLNDVPSRASALLAPVAEPPHPLMFLHADGGTFERERATWTVKFGQFLKCSD